MRISNFTGLYVGLGFHFGFSSTLPGAHSFSKQFGCQSLTGRRALPKIAQKSLCDLEIRDQQLADGIKPPLFRSRQGLSEKIVCG
jgi:hypothetical protein